LARCCASKPGFFHTVFHHVVENQEQTLAANLLCDHIDNFHQKVLLRLGHEVLFQ